MRITREFAAPPERVFRAHTDPELFAQWNGPRNLETRIDHYDCRTGGSYRYVMIRDGFEAGFHGCFHDVAVRFLRASGCVRGDWPWRPASGKATNASTTCSRVSS